MVLVKKIFSPFTNFNLSLTKIIAERLQRLYEKTDRVSWKVKINFWKESVRIKSVEMIWRSFEDAILEAQVQAAQLKSLKKPRRKPAWLNNDVRNGTRRLSSNGQINRMSFSGRISKYNSC